MKTIHILIITLFIIIENVFAQQGWQWQYPKPQGNTLRDIYVFNKDTAIAVGDLGTVIKTTDGGKSWDVQHHVGGTSYDLYSVSFIDNLHGWAVGGSSSGSDGNIVLKTNDGGKNWTGIKTDTTLPYYSVYFVDTDTGFVFGEDGIILRTTDGGSSWDTKSIDNYIGYYLDVFRFLAITFTDKQTGFLVGQGYNGNEIYKTTDCGRTWQWNEWIVNPKVYSLDDIVFVNKNNGFVAGEGGVFLKTTDGGNTWQRDSAAGNGYSVFFTDTLIGWTTGNGYILGTTDGGKNWEKVNSNQITIDALFKVRFSDKDNGWIVGGTGIIYRTTDGGNSWILQRQPTYKFNSIYFVDENTGWAVGGSMGYFSSETDSGIVFHTTNGGTYWERQITSNNMVINSVYAFDSQNVIAVGERTTDNLMTNPIHSLILQTTDGGETWKSQTIDTLGALNSISFATRNTGWIVGKGIFKTTDGGLSWQSQNTLFGLQQVQFINEGTGWVGIGYQSGNNLYKTTDGGYSWTSQVVDTNIRVNSFYFINSNIGWAVGSSNNGKNIYKTNDGGETWLQTYNTPKDGIYGSVYFINENIGWASGSNASSGQIIKTTDGGNTWAKQECPASNELSGLFFINENIGYAIGNDGIFSTTDGGGVMGIKGNNNYQNNIPTKIELYQNYPNPFNPSTVIEYMLNKQQHVKLQVFNILGQEIEAILDEVQNAGEHRITWNSKGISSGVYFYRLTTASGVITRKMLLIR